jgi:hypothetical protein
MRRKKNPIKDKISDVPAEMLQDTQSRPHGNVSQWKPNQREIFWVVGTMLVIIGALILVPLMIRELMVFEYKGLTFTREKFGEIPVYHYSYYFTDAIGQQYQYNLYLRNDPRENTIPIDNDIQFNERRGVYLTLNSTALAQCPTSLRDIATLAQFLRDNLIKVEAGNIEQEIAAENNLTHINCSTHPNNAVIAIVPDKETKITQAGTCHTISYASCEDVLPAFEKFIVEAILDAKAYASA